MGLASLPIGSSNERLTPDLTIVVPTYNERHNLDTLLGELFVACAQHRILCEVIIVDDDSSDGTGAHADTWTAKAPVRVIHRSGKLGLGSAVMEGFAAATSDIVGVIDADLSHPPHLVGTLYATMMNNDLEMVVASRYAAGGGTGEWAIGRKALSRLGCALTRGLTPVRDAMSGYFLIRRRCLTGLTTSSRGFKIGLELLVRTAPRRVAEVGYVFVERAEGESKMTMSEGLIFLRQLVSLYTESRSRSLARPFYLAVTPPLSLPYGAPAPETPRA